jgi:hypothetical protein
VAIETTPAAEVATVNYREKSKTCIRPIKKKAGLR